jgi:hypothetical protein
MTEWHEVPQEPLVSVGGLDPTADLIRILKSVYSLLISSLESNLGYLKLTPC